MSRHRQVSPVGRSLMAAYIGLALGYLAFLAGMILCGIYEISVDGDHLDDLKILFIGWMFLIVPLIVVGLPLALIVVLPVDRALASCRAVRSVFWTAGISLGGGAGFSLMSLVSEFERRLFGLDQWHIWVVPLLASIVTGWVIGEQLWKRRAQQNQVQ